MLVPLMTFFAYAEGEEPTPTNVGTFATVTVSSSYNDYTPYTSINDGKIDDQITEGSRWQPNTPQRDPSLEGLNPWFTMSFADSYKVSEISLIMRLPNTTDCTVKFEAVVNGEWTDVGIVEYQNSPAYLETVAKTVKVTPPDAIETSQIKVTFSQYTSWDPPAVVECIVMAVPGTNQSGGTITDVDTSHHENIAPEAIPNVFSNYYAYSKAPYLNDNIIDGQINQNGAYEFWRPQTPQRDPSVAGTDAWFTLKFTEYKEISKITLLVELAYSTECIVKYEALIQGEWIEIGTAKYSTSPVYDNYSRVHKVSISIPETVTTKQIRGTISGYISWDPPMISECMVMGATGKAPEFDVPEGAYLTTNVALSGFGEASSSRTNKYPALANDDKNLTYWVAKDTADGQWFKVPFDKEYSVGQVGINLSAVKLIEDEENKINESYAYTVKIELLVNNAWTTVYTGDVATTEGADAIFTKTLDTPVKATAIKVTYVETNDNPVALSEVMATTSDGSKCIYIGDIITLQQKLSTAGGNLACYGTPYASSTFTYSNMSDVSYITDGLIENNSFFWLPATPACPAYCGVTLKAKATVDSVALYFNDKFAIDDYGDYHVAAFDVQYKNASGEYVTIASGTTVDQTTGKPIVAISFTPVETDDIRIVFKSNGGKFPFLKELEVYSHTDEEKLFIYSQFVALPTTRCLPAITKAFAPYTAPKRPAFIAKHHDKWDMNSKPVTFAPSADSEEK